MDGSSEDGPTKYRQQDEHKQAFPKRLGPAPAHRPVAPETEDEPDHHEDPKQ